MPYFKTSQEWLEQSILLLEARPTTVRTYRPPPPSPPLRRPLPRGGRNAAGGQEYTKTRKNRRARLAPTTYVRAC